MSKLAARSLVFFASAAILVLEILAGRMMAPYVGVTLETWTGIIGTILAGISIGSWLGGRLADRYQPAQVLPLVLLIGGGCWPSSPTPSSVWLAPQPAESRSTSSSWRRSVLFAPAAVLSAVTPTVTKLRLEHP